MIESANQAACLAICYLRKMRQWNEGKINLAVPGEAEPLRMTNEEIAEQMNAMIRLRDLSDA